jgi:hypothetical protein
VTKSAKMNTVKFFFFFRTVKICTFITKGLYILRTGQDPAFCDDEPGFRRSICNRLPLVLLCGIRPSCWPPRSTCRRSCLHWAGRPPLAAANWPTLRTKHNSDGKKSHSKKRRRKYKKAQSLARPNRYWYRSVTPIQPFIQNNLEINSDMKSA